MVLPLCYSANLMPLTASELIAQTWEAAQSDQ